MLVGITTILQEKRALLEVEFPAQPPEPAKEVSCILTLGQREGPVEVLAIDEVTGTVRVNNSGTKMLLSFTRDGPRQQDTPLISDRRLPANRPPRLIQQQESSAWTETARCGTILAEEGRTVPSASAG
jgi:hypothetical protein